MKKNDKVELHEEFEGFDNGGLGTWSDDFTEEKGYTRYIMYENSGELFRTQTECRKKICVDSSSLSKCLSGKIDNYKGMRFRYAYLREGDRG